MVQLSTLAAGVQACNLLNAPTAQNGTKDALNGNFIDPACGTCVNEIRTPEEYHQKKTTLDLIIDVRTWHEYIGEFKIDNQATDWQCKSKPTVGDGYGKAMMEQQKCKMGHDVHMHFLEEQGPTDRTDRASAFKNADGHYTFSTATMKALADCYGDKLKTMKIGVSCYSGFRSRMFQNGMVKAGFTCGNIYNIGPGAQGLWRYDNSTFVKGAASKGLWSCPTNASASSTGNTSASSTASGSSASTETSSSATGLAGLGFTAAASMLLTLV